jgi:apolipoprotein N-acyltransferase
LTTASNHNYVIQQLKAVIVLSAGSVCLALSFPSAGLWLLAWIALIPLMLAVKWFPDRAFVSGWFFGTLTNMISFFWVTHSMTVYGGLPEWIAGVALLIMSLILGAFIAVPVWVAESIRTMSSGKIPRVVLWPICWVAFEYIRAHLPLGLAFPWNSLGQSQYAAPYILQNADWGSFYGISFLIVLVNAAVFSLVTDRPIHRKTISVAALFVITSILYGAIRYHSSYSGESFRVGIVQANVDLNEKWQPESRWRTLMDHIHLSEKICPENPQLLVWSESSIPFHFRHVWMYDDGNKGTLGIHLDAFMRQSNVPLLTGTLDRLDDDVFNAVVLAVPNGTESYFYKQRLVPFGEFVPLKDVFFFVNRLVDDQIGEFTAGNSNQPLVHPGGARIAITICYENIFPELVRERVRAGADMICNVTNDAWFGDTAAPGQHFSAACFRAVEMRRPVVRCANSGISGAVDARGRILARTSVFTQEAFVVSIYPGYAETVYLRFGDWFARGCLFAMIVLYLSRLITRRRAA